MVQNLKIDIIYYNTPSDFEFEFNLGGCCHSRILNSRTSSPKELLESLSKAVNRSRIILVIGKINEDDGLMTLISKAIGIPLTKANADEFGISSPDDPEILKNSLPLVSKDGILSGCIVESGPQAIILIPENKSLRKDVSENLIFPYITALSRTPETDNVLVSNTPEEAAEEITEEVSDAIPEETESLQPDAEEIVEEIAEETENSPALEEEVPEILLPAEETDEVTQAEDSVKEIEDANQEAEENILFINKQEEPESDELEAPPAIDDNYVFTNNISDRTYSEEAEYDSDEGELKPKKPLSGLTLAILIICGVLLIVAAVLLYMLVYEPITSSIPVIEYVKEVFNFS